MSLIKIQKLIDDNNGNLPDVIMRRKCKKSLYKSTYNRNAFTKGKIYDVIYEDDDFIYIIDNEGRPFNMHKNISNVYYYIDDYFNTLKNE